MANPFGSDTVDYGTVSGHSSGFKSGGDFNGMSGKVGNLVLELRQSTQRLRQEEIKIGTSSDTEEFRGTVQGIMRKTLNKVQTGKSLLEDLASLARDTNDGGQKIAVKSMQQKMTAAINEFQEVSQEVLRGIEHAGEPVRITTRRSSDTYSDRAELSDHHDRARLFREDRDERRDERKDQQQQQQQQQQQVIVSDDTSHMEERAELMEQIENDILALNDLMGDMGRLVVEQGETTDHIEGNVEHAYDDVIVGNQQLEKGVRIKKCSRKLMCVIFSVLGAVLAIILIVIIAVIVHYTGKKK